MSDQTHSEPLNTLRAQAEALWQSRAVAAPADLAALTPQEVAHLFHELQVHQIELEMQNEQLRQSQLALEASREKYFDLYDLAPVGYCTLNPQGTIIEANLTFANLLGRTRDELCRQSLSKFILPADQTVYYHHRRQLFATQTPQTCEVRLVKRDGTHFWVHLEGQWMAGQDPTSDACWVALTDINTRMLIAQQLQATLAEKDLLLAEVHHRVKNNLGMLVALIGLQMETLTTPEARRVLENMEGRIMLMVKLYEKLYQADNITEIDVGQLIRDLVQDLDFIVSGYAQAKLYVDTDAITMPINRAITCGLMVNELVTNALKYAFKEHPPENATIHITFKEQTDTYLLRISDNGCGLPPDVNWQTAPSLGLQLINMWATRQLQGNLTVNTQKGTTFTIHFPKPNSSAS